MLTDTVTLAVFTGTGNTLVAARHLAQTLAAAGKTVRIVPMEKPELHAEAFATTDTPADTLGLIIPVACFTTYPTVWRFLDALPPGEGRGVFLLATKGGFGAGMQGPIGRALRRKGYSLIASDVILACGNHGADAPTGDKREAALAKLRARTEKFAAGLLAGKGGWSLGLLNPISALFYWFGRKRISFYGCRRNLFPKEVNPATCAGCGLCAALCPERAVEMKNGKPAFTAACQSCQRCVGFCPTGSITAPGKPPRQYTAVPLESLRSFLATTPPAQ